MLSDKPAIGGIVGSTDDLAKGIGDQIDRAPIVHLNIEHCGLHVARARILFPGLATGPRECVPRLMIVNLSKGVSRSHIGLIQLMLRLLHNKTTHPPVPQGNLADGGNKARLSTTGVTAGPLSSRRTLMACLSIRRHLPSAVRKYRLFAEGAAN